MTNRRPNNLGSSDGLPAGILARLEQHRAVLQQIEFSEQFEAHPTLHEIMCELDDICVSEGIVGIHYTRGERERFLAEGLIPRTGAERRQEFLNAHGHRFTYLQRSRLIEGWQSYFNPQQNCARDGRVWFNLTRAALSNGGAEPLLSLYGGEVISMPFSADSDIGSILSGIGSPLIIECALDAQSVHTFSQYPWGRTWVSSYHRSVNSAAYQYDVDLYTEQAISPSNILNIEVLGNA